MFENSVHLMGRIVKEPELKTAGDSYVVNFRIAINRITKKGEHPETDFVDCVAWNRDAEFLSKYFHKGDKVGIEGRIQVRTYKNKDDVDVRMTEVACERLAFIEKKSGGGGDEAHRSSKAPDADVEVDDDDDDVLPF